MNLASINIAAILPALVLSVFGIVVMVVEPFVSERRKSGLGWLALAGTLAAMLALVPMANNRGQWYSNLWIVDDYDVFLNFVFRSEVGSGLACSCRYAGSNAGSRPNGEQSRAMVFESVDRGRL